MSNSAILNSVLRFFFLLVFQVLIFNEINFLGYINPFPYILYILLFPVNGNKVSLLISSFLLGLIVDMFLNSSGIHSTACLILAYFRPAIFRFSFGLSYEYQTVKINDSLSPERLSFIFLCVILHHISLFILEIFTFEFFWRIIVRTLLSTLFTTIICILIIYLIKPSRR